ncbi:MAG: ribose-phosphate diphosphokinase [Caulobacterales bacterium]
MTDLGVCGFADEAQPASRLAASLGAPFAPLTVHRFPDGETMPIAPPPAAATTVVYRSLDRPNEKLVDLLLAADALRRAGAPRLILVAPYFCYLRQDQVFAPGEPLSRDVIAPLVGARFDGVVTVQAHLHRTPDLARALQTRAVNLWAVEPLAAALGPYATPPLVIGPDEESSAWAQAWARRLGGQSVSLSKTRQGDRSVTLDGSTPIAAADRPVVIIDDIASSGETLAKTTALARDAGALSIDVAIVHALLDAGAAERLIGLGARRIVSTDSVQHPTNAAELAPILADAVREMIASA